MKVEEVPQDLKYMKGTVIRDVDYAIGDDGRYKTVVSSGWEPKNVALELTMSVINEECEAILEKVRRGESSPLEYHAARGLMSVELLADYAGVSKRTVRKHFQPKYFAKLDEKMLATYADVLRISVDELKRIPE